MLVVHSQSMYTAYAGGGEQITPTGVVNTPLEIAENYEATDRQKRRLTTIHQFLNTLHELEGLGINKIHHREFLATVQQDIFYPLFLVIYWAVCISKTDPIIER